MANKKKINDIYKSYFQKSRVFLYPALNIRKGTGFKPIDTYLCWEDQFTLADNRLVCLYELSTDNDFIAYEEKYLLGNPLFEDYLDVGDNKAIYIFNYDSYAEDFSYVVEGRYSEVSIELKVKIKDYYGVNSPEYKYIKSYLHPDVYYREYAEILSPQDKYVDEMISILEETVELCSKPDFKKEKLEMSIKSLEL